MNLAEEYFMVVVEEQSMARAAEKLYLSQQNLSNSIKRLEQQYGTLFRRKPQFQLTAEGRALYQTLQQIRVLENNLTVQLREIEREDAGSIRFGIPATRGRLLLPQLLKCFRHQFPHTQVDLVLDDTEQLEQLLLRGSLDLMLGIDVSPRPELINTICSREKIYLVVSKGLLREHGMEEWKEERLAELPFLLNPPISRLRQEAKRYFRRLSAAPSRSAVVGDFELQLLLAAQGEGACFCTQMMLTKMEEINRGLRQEEQLCAFPLRDENAYFVLSIVRHRYGINTRALGAFADILARLVQE